MLTSSQNPLVKQMRKLHRAKERKKQNLILLEGTNLIEAVLQVNYSLVTVCYTRAWADRYWYLLPALGDRSLRMELVGEVVLASIATTVNPDGVVATAPRRDNCQLNLNKVNLGLVLERLQDPGNLGTIIRTAVATNTDAIVSSDDSVDPENPKVLRASAGEWFKLAIAHYSNLPAILKDFRDRNGQAIATVPRSDLTYWEIDFNKPSLILLGNEAAGLSDELINLADIKVNIPLAGGVESLNVGIAAALLLYEARRQKNSNIF